MVIALGIAAAIGWGLWSVESNAHLETTERLTQDVNTAKANANTFETALKSQVAEFATYKKASEDTQQKNEESLDTYARIEEAYMVKEAKYQKRLKQYERVFIEKPELYSRAYATFYNRGLRKLEKITTPRKRDSDSREDGPGDADSAASPGTP